MALADEVTTRIGTTRLVQLTRRQGDTAATVDTDLLAAAVTDVGADFELHGGASYDGDNAIHVRLGVSGVVAKLQEYTGNGAEWASAHREKYEKGLALLRERTGFTCTSSSNLTPSDEQATRPKLDRGVYSGYTGGVLGAVEEDASEPS